MKKILKSILVAILTALARLTLRRYRPTIIAVAGSVGKTSTKDAIYTVLSGSFSVRKGEKSYNSEIGVPLAILGLPNAWMNPFGWTANILRGLEPVLFRSPYPRYLVLEIGADAPGDIRRIVSWVKPNIAVITRFGEVPVHVEFFKDRKELIEEDGCIVEALASNGLLILNQDDDDSRAFKERTNAKSKTYGFDPTADIVASNVQITYGEDRRPSGITYKVDMGGTNVPLRIPNVVGRAQVYASLPALLIGEKLGINLVTGGEALAHHRPPPGRLNLIQGLKGAAIIDDSYNSSPVAAEEALRALKEIKTKGRKIAVLGDMLELGRNSEPEHLRIGKLAGTVADLVVTVGIRARRIAEGALQAELSEKNVFQFETSKEAGKFVEGIMGAEDIILVKGSQGIRMERIVEEIMQEPERKNELLVRQNEEWKKK